MNPININGLDDVYLSSGYGGRLNYLSSQLYGITDQRILPIPNRDRNGYVFFTRPQLNLSDANVRHSRKIVHLVNDDINSIANYVRLTLDPRMHSKLQATKANSLLVDPYNIFIPALTNHLQSLSGFPDEVLNTHSSSPGVRKEVHTMVDSVLECNDEFDLDATFINIQDEPLINLFQTWEKYAGLVSMGEFLPYTDFMVENEIDYNTRIWRIVTDPNDIYVKKIAATGPAIPTTVPSGKFADYNADKETSTDLKDFTVRFRCNGVEYNDPILIKEFNMTVGIANPVIRKCLEYTRGADGAPEFVKVRTEHRGLFNYRVYPYINPNTYELCWLALRSDPFVKEMLKLIKERGDYSYVY